MSKKKDAKRRPPKGGSRRTPAVAAIVALTFFTLAAGAALTRWEPARRAAGLQPVADPAARQPQGSPALSKEYVYAGGRLIATEEPTPAPLGPPPTGLVATAASASSVHLTWSAPAGNVLMYKVERRQGGPFAEVAEVAAGPPALSFDDTGLSSDSAYLYQVRAVFAGGGLSAYSNKDLATTVVFEDDPLLPGQTPVRFRHVEQIRTAVDAVRAVAFPGQGGADWSGAPAAQQHGLVRAAHLLQLRENLNPALAALGLGQVSDDATLAAGQPIRAAHVEDLRQKVK